MKEYFELDLYLLQIASSWALKYVEDAVVVFEKGNRDDKRPRNAFSGMKIFAETGSRPNYLRKLAMDAYRASREEKRLILSFAANSASLGAAIAYTHPYKDPKQAEHILGPVVYSILASENGNCENEKFIIRINEACSEANEEIIELINKYPAQVDGNTLKKHAFFRLDHQLRNKRNR